MSTARLAAMRHLMRELDVDLLDLAYDRLGATYARACEVCLACGEAASCSAWLAAASPSPLRPGFCPNLAVFERFVRN